MLALEISTEAIEATMLGIGWAPHRRGARSSVAALGLAVLLGACGGGTPAVQPSTDTSPTATAPSTSAPNPTSPNPPTPSPTTPTPTPSQSPVPTAGPTTAGLPEQFLGNDWTVIPTSAKVVALTFDGGANADALPSILQTLRAQSVTATFFLTGDFAQRYPAMVAQISADGHVVGNHTMTHPALTTLTGTQITAEVESAAEAIVETGGADPRPWFRFPFGDRDQTAISRVNDLGYVCVRWTVDTLGWQGTDGGQSAESVRQRVVDAARPGEIVLMHVGSHPQDGSTLDADALPDVIASLRALGYQFTTVEEFLR